MTEMHSAARRDPVQHAGTYLMCPPEHFAVDYVINPWMNPDVPVDPALAMSRWQQLHTVFAGLGHTVHFIDPEPGLPDMVFAANGGTVIGGKVLGARCRYPQRAAEGMAYLDWFRRSGFQIVREPGTVNEGEGEIVFAETAIIAGHGFRSDPGVSGELEELFGLPVVSVRLVDLRFYHLDTALCVLGGGVAAYYPAAFDEAGQADLAGHITELIEAKDADAEVLGLNAVSDGGHVVLPEQATGLTATIEAAGFEPVPVDLSEPLKAGGGPKCCTLELRH